MARLQIATAVAAALAVPIALTGCVGVPDDSVKADIATSDGLDLSAAADELGLQGAYVSPRLINFPARELADRYGRWTAPR